MQTFVPYEDPAQTAETLDPRRLRSQRNECKTIYNCLRNLHIPSWPWANHPAVRMWKGHEAYLLKYAEAMSRECLKRDYNDTLLRFYMHEREDLLGKGYRDDPPAWYTDPYMHRMYRATLIRKLPEWYGPIWLDITPEELATPFPWPVPLMRYVSDENAPIAIYEVQGSDGTVLATTTLPKVTASMKYVRKMLRGLGLSITDFYLFLNTDELVVYRPKPM